jgi:hypothetical protein
VDEGVIGVEEEVTADISMAESSSETLAMAEARGTGSAVTVGAEAEDLVVADDCLVEVEGVRFFCFFDAGQRGHVCES